MRISGATYYLVRSARGVEIWPARERDIECLLKLKSGFERIGCGFKTLEEAKWNRRLLEARSPLSNSAGA